MEFPNYITYNQMFKFKKEYEWRCEDYKVFFEVDGYEVEYVDDMVCACCCCPPFIWIIGLKKLKNKRYIKQ